MITWEFIKHRTATADGAVWRSNDGKAYRRTGGHDIESEVSSQQHLRRLDYPVPEIVDSGVTDDGLHYFTERSAGDSSLHDQALADMDAYGQVSEETISAAAAVSSALLTAQSQHSTAATPDALRRWFEAASFIDNVLDENPDFNTDHTQMLVDRMLERLATVPMCLSHLDYGLPNAYRHRVIDWQHHADAPLGYDVYPMLDIAAFKGGNKGYSFTRTQRDSFSHSLDDASLRLLDRPLSEHLGDFLLVKCFFFLALMKPPADGSRPDKQIKWEYRRTLFQEGLAQYEATGNIDTAEFPTLDAYTAIRS